MRIGLIYDLFDDYPWQPGDPLDADAEYEPVETATALEMGLRHLGHEVVHIGTARDLLKRLDGLELDVALNITEGAHTRNREAWVPILLELAGIPCLGSDALTLSISLDKTYTKDLAVACGVPTPPYRVYRAASDIHPENLPGPFPLFVKPRYEGSSKGISARSKVSSLPELREQASVLVETYRQDALVEPFVEGGGEFTVCVVGNNPAEALPVLQRAVEKQTGIGLHALEHRGADRRSYDYDLEGVLTRELETHLQEMAVRIYDKLECKDFARVDFRVDRNGQAWFLEINPLPTFAPDGTFAIVSELMGLSYPHFLAHVLERGLKRLVG